MTLPCHTSLFFSMAPEAHGITTNTWQPLKQNIPGLFEVIFQAGLHAAAFFNWEQLRDLHPPGSLKAAFYLEDDRTPENESDRELAALAVDYFKRNRVDFSFNYFHQTDAAAHRDGYMSPSYLKAITNADRCIGNIVDVCPENSILIVTSDHGGYGNSHGTDRPEETTIPLIIRGPGIPKGHRIEQVVKITDVAPTISAYLGIAPPAEWIGKALTF
jgi:arylsulfatase A-like enzyme